MVIPHHTHPTWLTSKKEIYLWRITWNETFRFQTSRSSEKKGLDFGKPRIKKKDFLETETLREWDIINNKIKFQPLLCGNDPMVVRWSNHCVEMIQWLCSDPTIVWKWSNGCVVIQLLCGNDPNIVLQFLLKSRITKLKGGFINTCSQNP